MFGGSIFQLCLQNGRGLDVAWARISIGMRVVSMLLRVSWALVHDFRLNVKT